MYQQCLLFDSEFFILSVNGQKWVNVAGYIHWIWMRTKSLQIADLTDKLSIDGLQS